jgi:hypothetical protein
MSSTTSSNVKYEQLSEDNEDVELESHNDATKIETKVSAL